MATADQKTTITPREIRDKGVGHESPTPLWKLLAFRDARKAAGRRSS